MKSFIIELVSKIVDAPDKVVVSETVENGVTLYEIRVADADVGKVIGRGGMVANAIRTIVKVMAMRERLQVNIDVYSSKRLQNGEHRRFEIKGGDQ